MALPATFFVWLSIASARCNDDNLGSSGDRRAVIGEGADTRNGIFGRASHRGSREHKGEGKDKTEGPHVAVSGLGPPMLPAVLVGILITIRCFRMSAPKAGNGFINGRFVSSPATGRNIRRKSSINSAAVSSPAATGMTEDVVHRTSRH